MQVGRTTADEQRLLIPAFSTMANCRSADPWTVDLHNLTVAQAKIVMEERLSTWWNASSQLNAKPLTIIVGEGSHSKGGLSRLQPAVESLLQRLGYQYANYRGEILVNRRVQ